MTAVGWLQILPVLALATATAVPSRRSLSGNSPAAEQDRRTPACSVTRSASDA